MKKILAAILVTVLTFGCTPAYTMGVFTSWTESKIFAQIRGAYGQPISYNDGVFDCEDFSWAFLKTMGPSPDYIRVAVGIYYKGEEYGHCVAGLVFSDHIVVVEPQTGHYVRASTAYEAVTRMEKNVESVLLIPWADFEKLILEK